MAKLQLQQAPVERRVLGQPRRRPAGVVRQHCAGAVAVDVEPEGVDVDPEQAVLLDPGAGEPLLWCCCPAA